MLYVSAVGGDGGILVFDSGGFEVRVVKGNGEPIQNMVLNKYPYRGDLVSLGGIGGERVGIYITVVETGEAIDGSPFVFEVEGGMGDLVVISAAIGFTVLVVCALLGCAVAKKSHSMNKAALAKISGEHSDLKEQLLEMERMQDKMAKDENVDDKRHHRHTDGELLVMQKAMDELENERRDEMVSVMIPSRDIKLDKVVGKGAFGIVYVGTLMGKGREMVGGSVGRLSTRMRDGRSTGTKGRVGGEDGGVIVAVKQLISVDESSVERFRFECFLMKELRHPNIVSFVGICWDEVRGAGCGERSDPQVDFMASLVA